MLQRLQKLLSAAGLCSRRTAETWIEHLERREVGGHLDGLVREALLGLEAPRGALVAVRAAQYGSHPFVEQLLCPLQAPFYVADVSSCQKYHTCHNSIALTLT